MLRKTMQALRPRNHSAHRRRDGASGSRWPGLLKHFCGAGGLGALVLMGGVALAGLSLPAAAQDTVDEPPTPNEKGKPKACIKGGKFVGVKGLNNDGSLIEAVKNSVEDPEDPTRARVNGENNVPAEDVDIPVAFFDGQPVLYEFQIENCGGVDLYNVRLDDCIDVRSVRDVGFLIGGVGDGGEANCEQPRLVPSDPVRVVAEKLAPGDSVKVTSLAFTGDPINPESPNFINICETYGEARVDGIVRNDVEFEAEADMDGNGSGETFVSFDELNLVQCQPPPEECDITLDKTCQVFAPTADLECTDKIVATTLSYIGPEILGATVAFDPDKGPTATYSGVDLIPGETVLTMPAENGFTIDARPDENELGSKTKIRINGVEEVIHTSCSTPYVAGEPAPLDKPKGDPSPNWFVESFVDKGSGQTVSVPSPGPGNGDFKDNCSFVPGQIASCDTTGKPDRLTWLYNGGSGGGGDCADSTFLTAVNEKGKPHKDFTCSGSVDVGQPITVVDDKGNIFDVAPGESFMTGLKESKRLALSNGGGSQSLEFHVSCSQPIAAGLTAGALTLEALDGSSGGAEVTYKYEVTNLGTVELKDVSLTDDQLGTIANDFSLAPGAIATFEESAMISKTTTNVATATGSTGFENGECSASDSVKVTVEVEAPPSPPVAQTCKDIKEITGVTMIWDGPSGIAVTNNETGDTQVDIQNGDEVFFETPKKDTTIGITGAVTGQSVFHVSCSDEDMDGTDDCGKLQGNGKKDDGGINLWLLEGMTGEKGSFTCSQ